jgi:hypothetical protein
MDIKKLGTKVDEAREVKKSFCDGRAIGVEGFIVKGLIYFQCTISGCVHRKRVNGDDMSA